MFQGKSKKLESKSNLALMCEIKVSQEVVPYEDPGSE